MFNLALIGNLKCIRHSVKANRYTFSSTYTCFNYINIVVMTSFICKNILGYVIDIDVVIVKYFSIY